MQRSHPVLVARDREGLVATIPDREGEGAAQIGQARHSALFPQIGQTSKVAARAGKEFPMVEDLSVGDQGHGAALRAERHVTPEIVGEAEARGSEEPGPLRKPTQVIRSAVTEVGQKGRAGCGIPEGGGNSTHDQLRGRRRSTNFVVGAEAAVGSDPSFVRRSVTTSRRSQKL